MKIKYLKYLSFVLLAMFVQCRTTKAPSGDSQFYRGSDYIFQGEIVKANASNMPQVAKSGNTYVVKVTKALQVSEGHESFEGKEITVVINKEKAATVKEGASYTFYTNTWLFGNTLAVVANQLDTPAKSEEVVKNIALFREQKENAKLKILLGKSELITLGKVMDIRDVPERTSTKESEHSPEWKIASIIVEEVIKGDVSKKNVELYFQGSDDIHWYKSPKFRKDERGIFLLKKADANSALAGSFLLTNPNDFLQASELERVKKLLNNK